MAEKNNGISSVMESLLKGANALMSTKTVVGEATKIDDTIIVPLVDVSFGVGAGASCNGSKDGGAGGLSKENDSVRLIKNVARRSWVNKNQGQRYQDTDMIKPGG